MRKLLVKMSMATLVGVPLSAEALGLGEIEVSSYLNQPLSAEIQVLSVRPGEIDDLLVNLAKREAFRRAGLARPSVLDDLKFELEKDEEGTTANIKVSTKNAVREPFLNFLVEADWSSGRVIREYTILLDPPHIAEYFNNPSAATSTTAAVSQGDAIEPQTGNFNPVATTRSAPAATPATSNVEPSYYDQLSEPSLAELQNLNLPEAAPIANKAPSVAPSSSSAPATSVSYDSGLTIQKGDTLWSIASQYQQSGQSMSQVMLAFQRVNPDAFVQQNINGMRVGQVLRVPQQQDIESVTKQQAYAQVLEQNGLWDAYLARVGGSSSGNVSASAGGSGSSKSSELSIVAPGEEGKGGSAASRKQITLLEDDLEAARVENQELRSRVKDLESQINKLQQMQNLVQLQSDTMAELQNKDKAEPKAPAVTEVEPTATKEPMVEAEPEAAEAPVEMAEAKTPAPVEIAEPVMPKVEPQPPVEATPKITPPKTPAPIIITEPKSSTQPGMIDKLLGNPLLLAAGGGAVVLLLLLLLLMQKKRKAQQEAEQDQLMETLQTEAEDPLLDDDSTPIHMPASAPMASAAGEETGTENTLTGSMDETSEEDIFSKETVVSSPPAAEEPAAEEVEQDDVLNEADVYLAYGLYDNAEELLKTNIDEQPQRADYRAKLLDTFFAVKNADAFIGAAQELRDLGGAADPYWQRVQVMGYELAPEHALFSGASDSGLSAADLDFAKPEMADIDLGVDESSDMSATDFDLGADFDLSDSAIEGTFDSTQVIAPKSEFEETAVGLETDDLDSEEDRTLIRGEEEVESLIEELPDSLDLDLDQDGAMLDSEASLEISALNLDDNDLEFTLGDEDLDTPEEAPEAEIDHGENMLDFDFDDLAGSANEEDKPEDKEEAVDIGDDMSVDMDFGDLDDINEETPAALETEADTEVAESDGLDLDLGMDIDVAESDPALMSDDAIDIADLKVDEDLGVLMDVAEPEPEPSAEDEIDINDLDVDMDFGDLVEADEANPESEDSLDLDASDEDEIDLSDISFEDEAEALETESLNDDNDLMEQDFLETVVADETDLTEGTSMSLNVEDMQQIIAEESAEPEMVETGIFSPGDFDDVPKGEASSSLAPSEETDLQGLMLPDGFDEVANKLDLAKAFMELGDNDAARSSLEEVSEEGSPEQQKEAQELLAQLG